MATLSQILNYLSELNNGINQINSANDYEVTRPTALKMAKASSNINFGNATKFVIIIDAGLLAINSADGDRQKVISGFDQFYLGVDMLRNYLQSHWWQFGADDKRPAITSVPKIEHLDDF